MIFTNNVDPVLFQFGVLQVRWYGLFFAIGLLLNYLLIRYLFKKRNFSLEHLDSVVLYLFFGLVIGARLGHILFYNWAYFSTHLIEIFKIWNGGLSSHGAAIGVFLAVVIWSYVHKIRFSKYVDILVIGMPITAGFVRIGNFFNSEILGIPTDGSWGVIFQKLNEDFPRHPSQIYEALINFLIFAILFFVYKKYYKKLPVLFITFLYIFLYFSTRFIVEYWKDMHELPVSFPFSMGQMLSVFPIVITIGYFARLWFKNFSAPKKNNSKNKKRGRR